MRTLLVLVVALLGAGEALSQPALDDRIGAELRQYLERYDLPKYALTVGIGDYSNLPPVTNALNDVRLMHQTLKDLGFKPDSLMNPTGEQLFDRLDEFSQRLVGSESGVKSVVAFYFAGHGFSTNGGNMIVPADAKADSNGLFEDSISLDFVVEKLSGKDVAVAIIFLDACRNEIVVNSQTSDDYFTEPRQHTNVYYGFASSFGQPSVSFARSGDPNSPFALALSTSLVDKNDELKVVFGYIKRAVYQRTGAEQFPQDLPALLGDYYFHTADDELDKQRQRELAATMILGGVCEYVNHYPAGPYSTGARAWLRDNPEFVVPSCPL